MKLFNQALLTRQAWRLVAYPDSLCARVLKAKYFPNGELIDTVFPSDSSPSWKGIEFGLELLKKGIIWRVGNGDKIQIWRDNWIPKDSLLKITGERTRCRLRWVSQLNYGDVQDWDRDLVKTIFHKHDAEEVLKIRIPTRPTDDFIAWHFEKSGIFSIKNFAWKLATEGLATMQNRKRRNLESDSTCRLCCRDEEDGYHAVVACTKSRALQWFLLLLDKLDTEERAQVFFCFWRAWHLRNDAVHGNGSASVEASARFVRNYWSSLLNIRHGAGHDEKGKSLAVSTWSPARRNDGVQRKTKEMPNWEPPRQGWVKINIDAAFSAQSGEASIGLIIRDHAG
ncbi:hypothetical protein PVAP13_8KG058660 [Panicum virgatum]|uniref:Reverse transcriptase zinc-binding domain-containing protein n=1 Tax=Panicum virgatum TaxID=38727 RepID=A0A8T0PGW8_PANVG|nr:hypothetical protein PVAP13_8KG058660 [Panicum virgatum]